MSRTPELVVVTHSLAPIFRPPETPRTIVLVPQLQTASNYTLTLKFAPLRAQMPQQEFFPRG